MIRGPPHLADTYCWFWSWTCHRVTNDLSVKHQTLLILLILVIKVPLTSIRTTGYMSLFERSHDTQPHMAFYFPTCKMAHSPLNHNSPLVALVLHTTSSLPLPCAWVDVQMRVAPSMSHPLMSAAGNMLGQSLPPELDSSHGSQICCQAWRNSTPTLLNRAKKDWTAGNKQNMMFQHHWYQNLIFKMI